MHSTGDLHGWNPWLLVLLIGAICVRVIVRRYCTSIRDIPGPFLASFSSLWQVLQILKGHTEAEILELHRKYGTLATFTGSSPTHPETAENILLPREGSKEALFALQQMKSVYPIPMP